MQSSFLFYCILTHVLSLSPRPPAPCLHLSSLYTFLLLTSPSLSPGSALGFSDGMCSCCFLFFPTAVFASAWGLWDCGRAALPWQRAMLPNCVHLGFGVSLHSLPLSYLFHLSLRFPLVQQRLSAPLSLSLSLSHLLCVCTVYHAQK